MLLVEVEQQQLWSPAGASMLSSIKQRLEHCATIFLLAVLLVCCTQQQQQQQLFSSTTTLVLVLVVLHCFVSGRSLLALEGVVLEKKDDNEIDCEQQLISNETNHRTPPMMNDNDNAAHQLFSHYSTNTNTKTSSLSIISPESVVSSSVSTPAATTTTTSVSARCKRRLEIAARLRRSSSNYYKQQQQQQQQHADHGATAAAAAINVVSSDEDSIRATTGSPLLLEPSLPQHQHSSPDKSTSTITAATSASTRTHLHPSDTSTLSAYDIRSEDDDEEVATHRPISRSSCRRTSKRKYVFQSSSTSASASASSSSTTSDHNIKRQRTATPVSQQRNHLYNNNNNQSNDPLIGKRHRMSWMNADGQVETVSGTVVHCEYAGADGERMSTIAYDDTAIQQPYVTTLTEAFALGGVYAAAFAEDDDSNNDIEMPPIKSQRFYCRLVVPDRKRVLPPSTTAAGPANVVELTFGDYVFTLQAKESLIPGAGLGLFLTVSSSVRAPGSILELPAGVLCDLGIYSTSERDKKSEVEVLLKNFLFDWIVEGWSYAHNSPQFSGFDVYDITTDDAGVLTDEARSNPLVYANETEGVREVATVCSKSVPNGQIHYYLCHEKEVDGPLRLILGETVELKTDYGPEYEKTRVRMKYPRVEGTELAQLRHEIRNDNVDLIRDISNYTASDVEKALRFLQHRLEEYHEAVAANSSPSVLAQHPLYERRLFVLALELRSRVKFMEQHNLSAKYSVTKATEKLSKHVMALACEPWKSKRNSNFKAWIQGMNGLEEAVVKGLGLSNLNSTSDLCDQILKL